MANRPHHILVVTVGGSCEPIVNCIGNPPQYDFVYFICSKGKGRASSELQVDGPGKPCKGKNGENASIVSQIGLEDGAYEKIAFDSDTEIDDVSILYTRFKELSNELKEKFPDAKITANYTGGTKSMSAALVLIAIECGWELQVNVGIRQDVKQVRAGDVPVLIMPDVILMDRNLRLYEDAFKKYNYAMAEAVAYATLSSFNLDARQRMEWIGLKTLATGFNLWDSFFYKEAKETLAQVGRLATSYMLPLANLTSEDAASGYFIVADLILNAERRKAQGRYDDGVARLYRALELFAQTRLKERYGLLTGELDIKDERIPDEFKGRFMQHADKKGKFQVPLKEAYELLIALDDPVGSVFDQMRARIMDKLKIRNNSFLAHGFEPIPSDKFDEMYNVVVGLVHKAMDAGKIKIKWPPQLPTSRL